MKQKVFDLAQRLFKPKARQLKSLAAAARAARERRDWPEAIRLGRQLLALDPGRTGQWVLLGHALKENGDPTEAEAAYREAIQLEPTRAETHLHLGHMLKRLNRPVDAADSLMRAIEHAPDSHEVVSDLLQLEGDGVVIDRERLRAALNLTLTRAGVSVEATDRAGQPAPVVPGVQMVFDISDLIGYFNHARLPTGIQRVQIEVVSALLTRPVPGAAIEIATFLPGKDHWVRLQDDLFLTLAEMALSGDDTQDPAWRAALARMWLSIMLETPLPFRTGASLINLGTSWGFGNYFLKVREVRRTHAIRYLPMVHDMVPILMPEFCVETLTQDFINWTTGVFAHADRFLANSEATKRDLITVAGRLGHVVAPDAVHVVRLDADFRKPGVTERPVEATLARHGLEEGAYVLFVSTIEPRKNHMAALRAWQTLIQRHGAQSVPRLVCVGRRGWKNGEVFETVQNDPELAARVSWLSGVSDADLADLYRGCAFNLYPSLYEGWGLPITESLCHGKPVLTSDVASLPEAGGDFADYFRLGDPDDLVAKLEALIFDLQHRQAREAHIQNDFTSRPWRDLAEDIVGQVLDWSADPGPGLPTGPRVAFDRPYSVGRLTTTQLRPNLIAGEIFRSGDGWMAPEPWGAWTRPQGGRLSIDLGDEPGPVWLMLGLRGPEEVGGGYDVMIGDHSAGQGVLEPDETIWISIPVARDLRPDGILTVEVRSRASEVEVEADDPTVPRAARATGIGVIGFALSRADPSADASSSVV